MRIALDYDQTYTEDREAWGSFIANFTEAGHEVCIVTFRDRVHDWNADLTFLEEKVGIKVYCTAGVAKAFWMENFGPGKVSVWIDDRPFGIFNNSAMTAEQLAEWRADNKAAEAAQAERDKWPGHLPQDVLREHVVAIAKALGAENTIITFDEEYGYVGTGFQPTQTTWLEFDTDGLKVRVWVNPDLSDKEGRLIEERTYVMESWDDIGALVDQIKGLLEFYQVREVA